VRMPQLMDELAVSRDEDWLKAKRRYARCELLVVDDLCEASHKSSNAKHRVMRSGRRRRTGTCVCALRHFA
jgi:DNA replication protein DnaC